MKSPFNKLNYIVADKTLKLHYIATEEVYEDPMPGDLLPIGYSKVPVQFKGKEPFISHDKHVSITAYSRGICLNTKELYDVDSEFAKMYVSSLVKYLHLINESTNLNSKLSATTEKPVVGSRYFDKYNNLAEITKLDQVDSAGRVRRVNGKKILNRYWLPYLRLPPEETGRYWYPYSLIGDNHFTVALSESRIKIRKLKIYLDHNKSQDIKLNQLASIKEPDNTISFANLAKQLATTIDSELIDEFKALAQKINTD